MQPREWEAHMDRYCETHCKFPRPHHCTLPGGLWALVFLHWSPYTVPKDFREGLEPHQSVL